MILKSHDSFQQKRLIFFLKIASRNIDGVIFNYSINIFFDAAKSLLVETLWFSLPSKKLSYVDYLTNFEMFYRIIRNFDLSSNGGLDFVKAKIKDATLRSFSFFNTNVPQNLSGKELKALEKLPNSLWSLVLSHSATRGTTRIPSLLYWILSFTLLVATRSCTKTW